MITEPNKHKFIRKMGEFFIDGHQVDSARYNHEFSKSEAEFKIFRTKNAMVDILKTLSPSDRLEVFSEFCRFCGDENCDGVCNNDD